VDGTRQWGPLHVGGSLRQRTTFVLKSAGFAFVVKCSIAKRKISLNFFEDFVMWSQMDIMYFTRHVVAWHATCQSPVGLYRLLGGNMLTRGILTHGIC
jgi:hypothetical protein